MIPTGELVQSVADHFTLWMINPPAAVPVERLGQEVVGPGRRETGSSSAIRTRMAHPP